MKIRKAVLADLDAILQIGKGCEGTFEEEYFTPGDKTYYRSVIKGWDVLLVAESEGTLLGYSVLSFGVSADQGVVNFLDIPEEEKPLVACLDSCLVLPGSRGLGIQSEFVRERELLAKQEGYKHLCVSIHPENLHSLNNMLRFGFEVKHKTEGKFRSPRYHLHKEII